MRKLTIACGSNRQAETRTGPPPTGNQEHIAIRHFSPEHKEVMGCTKQS